MQQRGLKIIINGVASYVPYKKETIAFWAERNNILKKTIKGQKGRDVEKNLATVTEASPEDVEKFIYPKAIIIRIQNILCWLLFGGGPEARSLFVKRFPNFDRHHQCRYWNSSMETVKSA